MSSVHVGLVQLFGIHPDDLHHRSVFITAVVERFHHRQICVVELHIFADQGDVNFLPAVVDPVQHFLPFGEIDVRCLDVQLPADDVVQAVVFQHHGSLIQDRQGQVLDDAVGLYVAEEGDLLPDGGIDWLVAAGNDNVGHDTEGLELLDRMLGGL